MEEPLPHALGEVAVEELAPLSPAAEAVVRATDRALRVVNRWFMVPALRAGLAQWIGTPIGGYILLLRVRGRRTGLVRETPISYLITDGAAWVLAGLGGRTQWYRNLLADPDVEIRLPGRDLRCRADVVEDADVRRRMLPRIARATGLPAYMIGCDPWRAGDDRIVEQLRGVPLVRLSPISGAIDPGPDDPGGRAWIWRQAVVTIGAVALVKVARAASRRLLRGGASR